MIFKQDHIGLVIAYQITASLRNSADKFAVYGALVQSGFLLRMFVIALSMFLIGERCVRVLSPDGVYGFRTETSSVDSVTPS